MTKRSRSFVLRQRPVWQARPNAPPIIKGQPRGRTALIAFKYIAHSLSGTIAAHSERPLRFVAAISAPLLPDSVRSLDVTRALLFAESIAPPRLEINQAAA